jgi:hypothetical protein
MVTFTLYLALYATWEYVQVKRNTRRVLGGGISFAVEELVLPLPSAKLQGLRQLEIPMIRKISSIRITLGPNGLATLKQPIRHLLWGEPF